MLGCGWIQTAVESAVDHSWNIDLGSQVLVHFVVDGRNDDSF